MASAIDSGVDTGNDSNDSSVQEKLSKMDLGFDNSSQEQNLDLGLVKETSPSKLQEPQMSSDTDDTVMEGCSRLTPSAPDSATMSLTHLQPASLMHGYEFRKSNYDLEINIDKRISEMFNVMNPKVGGGPLGTEYRNNQIVPKVVRSRVVCLRRCKPEQRVVRRCHMLLDSDFISARDTVRMCRAACHNNTQAMRTMLEAGLSPNCHDKYKRSPLHLAACMGYADMVKLLLDYGADPNAKDSIGNTPLHLAACTNHVAVITLLLKAGTRVSEKDMAGHSPLQLAITKFNIMKRSIMPHPVLKEQVCQVIAMLTEYMRRNERPSVDPDLLNKFESLVRVSDSAEEVESNIRDLLSNLGSLSLSGPS